MRFKIHHQRNYDFKQSFVLKMSGNFCSFFVSVRWHSSGKALYKIWDCFTVMLYSQRFKKILKIWPTLISACSNKFIGLINFMTSYTNSSLLSLAANIWKSLKVEVFNNAHNFSEQQELSLALFWHWFLGVHHLIVSQNFFSFHTLSHTLHTKARKTMSKREKNAKRSNYTKQFPEQ